MPTSLMNSAEDRKIHPSKKVHYGAMHTAQDSLAGKIICRDSNSSCRGRLYTILLCDDILITHAHTLARA